MKINFTKKEYKLLLDLLAVAEWVLYSQSIVEKDTDYTKLISKICSYAKDFKAEDLVEFIKEEDKFYIADHVYDKMFDKISDFVNEEFWEILEERLARRDIREKIGAENFDNLEDIERLKLIDEYKEKYQKEFYENGIKNLKLFGI